LSENAVSLPDEFFQFPRVVDVLIVPPFDDASFDVNAHYLLLANRR
jgi:uncharacterized protein (DUF2141 family)